MPSVRVTGGVATATCSAQGRPEADNGLSPRAHAFALAIVAGKGKAEAAIDAGYAPASAGAQASRLLRNVKVAAVISDGNRAAAVAAQVEKADVIAELWAIATADVRELSELRVLCCRYCHGRDHRYQRTPAERERDYQRWERAVGHLNAASARRRRHPLSTVSGDFDELGGSDYRGTRDPDPRCPECFGLGQPVVVFKDHRLLSPGARRMLAGVRQAPGGAIRLNVHNAVTALDKVARAIGAFSATPIDSGPTVESRIRAFAQRERRAEAGHAGADDAEE